MKATDSEVLWVFLYYLHHHIYLCTWLNILPEFDQGNDSNILIIWKTFQSMNCLSVEERIKLYIRRALQGILIWGDFGGTSGQWSFQILIETSFLLSATSQQQFGSPCSSSTSTNSIAERWTNCFLFILFFVWGDLTWYLLYVVNQSMTNPKIPLFQVWQLVLIFVERWGASILIHNILICRFVDL